MLTCRHCRRMHVSRPKGLCWRCSESKAIRERYPAAGYARYDDHYRKPPLPALPTSAGPGSEEKIAVMAQRFAHEEQLFSPDDADWDANVGKVINLLRQGRG